MAYKADNPFHLAAMLEYNSVEEMNSALANDKEYKQGLLTGQSRMLEEAIANKNTPMMNYLVTDLMTHKGIIGQNNPIGITLTEENEDEI